MAEDPTINELYLDALVRHQIYLLRSSSTIRNKVLALLNKTEKDIAESIQRRLGTAKGISPSTLKKLEKLQKEIALIRNGAWNKIDEVWLEDLKALTRQEPELLAGITKTVAPVVLELALPPLSALDTITKTATFEGKTLKEWSKSLRKTDLNRISDQIKIGMVQGESSQDIAKRVVGTKVQKGQDGITQLTRRDAEAVTRTAVNRLANAARAAFNQLNTDIIQGEQFVATLDSRTTAVCRANDGKIFDIGVGPMPPLHFNCRSLRVAVLDGEVLGERPAKPVSEQMLVRQYAKANNLPTISSRDSLPRGHKTKFDAFASKQVRLLTGQVPAKTTYQQWLGKQSAEFQDDVLGSTKGALFRRGGLPLDKFVNRQGDELTLSQLAQKHESAFTSAGLDPEDFLQ